MSSRRVADGLSPTRAGSVSKRLAQTCLSDCPGHDPEKALGTGLRRGDEVLFECRGDEALFECRGGEVLLACLGNEVFLQCQGDEIVV